MRQFLLLFLLSATHIAFGQGSRVIPDGLDCQNLTEQFESYREYCNELAGIERKAVTAKTEAPKIDLNIEERIAAMKRKGWERIKERDFDGAISYFEKALKINSEKDLTRHWLSEDYYRWTLTNLIDAVKEYRKNPVPEEKEAPRTSFWQGQGFADKKAEQKRIAEAVNCDSATAKLKDNSFKITVVKCWISKWKGTLQSARNKSPDASNSVSYEGCSRRSGYFMTNSDLRYNIKTFGKALKKMEKMDAELKEKIKKAKCSS